MENNSDIPTLKRKANANHTHNFAQRASPAKAFHFAVPKAAQERLKVAMTVSDIHEIELSLSELLQEIGNEKLLFLLKAADQPCGVVAVDKQVMAGVIEAQTIGYITPKTAPDRAPTKTDGAMCENFVNSILNTFTIIMEDATIPEWGIGFQTRSIIENTRLLGLKLDDIPFVMNKLSVNFENGKKQGEMLFVFPKEVAHVEKTLSDNITHDAPWAKTLQQSVIESKVQLTAVLHRTLMPLTQITDLKVGDIIEVPKDSITQIQIQGANGFFITVGKLGQKNGSRAVRLSNEMQKSLPRSKQKPTEDIKSVDNSTSQVKTEAPIETTPIAPDPDNDQADIETTLPAPHVQDHSLELAAG